METIVFVRHGEKPPSDEGQLSCQGLNRALALPDVLAAKFGRPDFIFAPLTTARTAHGGGTFSYVRPLMTIEPTADARRAARQQRAYAFDDLGSLQSELCEKSIPAGDGLRGLGAQASSTRSSGGMVSAFGGNEKRRARRGPRTTSTASSCCACATIRRAKAARASPSQHDHEGLDGLSTGLPGVDGKVASRRRFGAHPKNPRGFLTPLPGLAKRNEFPPGLATQAEVCRPSRG